MDFAIPETLRPAQRAGSLRNVLGDVRATTDDDRRAPRWFVLGAIRLSGGSLTSEGKKGKSALVPADFATTGPTRRARVSRAASVDPVKKTTPRVLPPRISWRARSTPFPSGKSRSTIANSKVWSKARAAAQDAANATENPRRERARDSALATVTSSSTTRSRCAERSIRTPSMPEIRHLIKPCGS